MLQYSSLLNTGETGSVLSISDFNYSVFKITLRGDIKLKKYLGQIIFNLVVACIGAALFKGVPAVADSAVATISAIVALMSALSVGNYMFIKQVNSGRKAFQPQYVITESTFENLNDPQDYIEVMKDLKDYSLCRQEAQKMIDQWTAFKKKSETLNAISSSGGVYDVVNQDVESVMLNNMVLFMKRTAIMQSASKQEALTIHKSYLKSLTDSNDKILSDYTSLLIEASQLTGEDSNKAEIESLQLLIDSIRNYRSSLEKGENQ